MAIPFHTKLDFNQATDNLFTEKEARTIESKQEKDISIKEYDQQLKTRIEQLMEREKIFKNPRLTLFDLATALDTHPKKISQVINNGFQMNFNDFVNSYRITEVINKVEANEDHLRTLLGLAFDSGFNSKSTFNRAFKKQTSCTPKEYFQEKR